MVGIIGKYVKLEDSYISVIESLHHAGFENNIKVKPKLIDCEGVTEQNAKEILKD